MGDSRCQNFGHVAPRNARTLRQPDMPAKNWVELSMYRNPAAQTFFSNQNGVIHIDFAW